MKAFSTLVMVFLMSFTLFAQTDKDLVKTEKVGDLHKIAMFYESGELHQVGFIKNDKLHGEWESFDRDGNNLAKATYENGKKVGQWMFWNNGKLSVVDYDENKIVQVKTFVEEGTQVVSN